MVKSKEASLEASFEQTYEFDHFLFDLLINSGVDEHFCFTEESCLASELLDKMGANLEMHNVLWLAIYN